MRIAHLILTYTNPQLTERMITRMFHPEFDFYIHVDKKYAIEPYLYLKNLPNTYFINKRTEVNWAGFNTVLACLACIKEIVSTDIPYDFINLLSGQDYPLKPARELALFFKQNIGKEFISYRDFKNEWPEGLLRMERYFLSNYNFKGKYLAETLINSMLPKRKFPNNLRPFGKSMFWMLSPRVAMFVVTEIANDSSLRNFFNYTWGSDEFVFQTLIMNSEHSNKVINENYRYIDWSLGGANPKILEEKDFAAIEKSGMLFARKIDYKKSIKLLDLIDLKLLIDK